MKNIMLSSMALLLGSSPVWAQETDAQLDFPVIGAPEAAATTGSVNVLSLSSNLLRIEQLTSPDTLTTEAVRAEIALPAVCNANHRVSLSSENNGLWRGTASETAPVGFASAVPYRASLEWGDETVTLQANAEMRIEASASLSSAAEAGPLKLIFSILPGETNTVQQAPLVAGVYTDTLRITVEPE
jgi:hypothetical protein